MLRRPVAPSRKGAPRGWSPCAGAPRQGCMASVSGSSQRGSARTARPPPGHTGQPRGSSSSCHRPAAAPPPPPAATGSPGTAAAPGRRQLRGRGTVTPGPPASAQHPTLRAQLLAAARLRGWPGPLPPALQPRAPLPLQLHLFAACSPGVSLLRVRWRPRAFPAAGPTSCASLRGWT